MFGFLGPLEIALILLAALLIFGTRLPKIAWNLGKSIVNFKQGLRKLDVREDIEEAVENDSGKSRSDA